MPVTSSRPPGHDGDCVEPGPRITFCRNFAPRRRCRLPRFALRIGFPSCDQRPLPAAMTVRQIPQIEGLRICYLPIRRACTGHIHGDAPRNAPCRRLFRFLSVPGPDVIIILPDTGNQRHLGSGSFLFASRPSTITDDADAYFQRL